MSSAAVCDMVLGEGIAKPSKTAISSSSSSAQRRPEVRTIKKKTMKPWVVKGWQTQYQWLRHDAGNGILKCKFCSIQWPVSSVKKIQLSTHAKAFKHLSLAKGVSGAGDSENAAALKLAPSIVEFRDTISQRLKGCSFRGANTGAKREQKMSWCVAEVLRERERKKLMKAHSVCVTQDAQGSRLSVRVSCCFGDDLEVSRSLIGYRTCKTGSEAVAAGTKKVIQQLFTKWRAPPFGWRSKQNIVLKEGMAQFCKKVVT